MPTYTYTCGTKQEAGAVQRLTLDYQPTYQRFRAKVRRPYNTLYVYV